MTRNEVLGKRIIANVQIRVKQKLEPLTYAVNILKPRPVEVELPQLATDGEYLFYNPDNVVFCYEKFGANDLEQQLVHILLHGILGHFTDTNYSRKKLAWRVMDLQVEQILDAIGMNTFQYESKPNEYKTIGMSLYHRGKQDKNIASMILRVGASRVVDPHEFWWEKPIPGQSASDENADRNNVNVKADNWKKAKEYLLNENPKNRLEDGVKDVVRALKNNRKDRNYGSQSDDANLLAKETEKKLDFQNVFRDFLQNKCCSKEHPDFFDKMLYQYGLDTYGDVPLIEPMEEQEIQEFDNLVIAIDTSGSCADYTDLFFTQLVSIFQDIETRFCFHHIYLIQCDASIQNVCVFSEIEELQEVGSAMQMYGFGGTSFVPVYQWIEDNLIEEKENVDCLLYFTDAYGDFPSQEPEYPSYFVIPEQELESNGLFTPKVPDWVKQAYLKDKVEIKE